MKKRILAMLLTLALCISCVPMSSAASYIPGPTKTLPGGFVVKEDNTLVAYEGEGGDVVIPDGITAIGSEAFANNKEITSVTIPDGVTSIGMRAFWSCKNLTQVSIPDSVSVIESFAFQFSGLTSVDIPGTVQKAGDYAFANCPNLSIVTLGRGITEIGRYMFQQSGVTEVVIPDTVTSIETQAFHECDKLTAVTIPPGVESISLQAFSKKGVVFNKDLTIYCEPGSAAATHAEQWANPVYGTFDEDGTFAPAPVEPDPVPSEEPSPSATPSQAPNPISTAKPISTPTPTPKPTPSAKPSQPPFLDATPSQPSTPSPSPSGSPIPTPSISPALTSEELTQMLEEQNKLRESTVEAAKDKESYQRNLAANQKALESIIASDYCYCAVPHDVYELSNQLCQGFDSDLERVYALYHWVDENIKYDRSDGSLGFDKPSAQEVITKGKHVCIGFASVFQGLCAAQDIPCVIVHGKGDGEGHAWNIVQLDGKWLWADPTWGGMRNFLCSTEYISIRHWAYSLERTRNYDADRANGRQAAKQATKFYDLSPWALKEVQNALCTGLVPDELQVNYDSEITREDFCELIVQTLKKHFGGTFWSYEAARSCPFTDTSNFNIQIAYALGIVKGTSETTFNPNGKITRQEAATMLTRTAKVLNMKAGQSVDFADADSFADWGKEGIAFVSGIADPYNGKKVMEGTGGGNFSPLGVYSREQAIITALRLFSAAGNQVIRANA